MDTERRKGSRDGWIQTDGQGGEMDGTDRQTDRMERRMDKDGQTDTVARWMDTQTERRTGWRDG